MGTSKTTIESLPCEMTPAELALKSSQMASKLDELNGVEAEKSRVTKKLGEDMKTLKAQLDHLGTEVRTGIEYRPIECYEVPRYERLKVDLVRMDTGEIVRSRAMHPNERQEALDLGVAEAHSGEH